ncbi:ABC transporter permease [Solimonas marina]|uniref:ABC transporter permease n=1 Tax=Solimonas marina TaxID=2714601 RepID=A0A969W965_9GAMM|nr:ABC transporter permease [Solimonas marina]NKF21835.1 ABC transporter permease [Solimonas marina]
MNAGRALRLAWRQEIAVLRADRWERVLLWVMPGIALLFMAWMFARGTLDNIPIVVVDLDHSTFSRRLTRELDASPRLDVCARTEDMAQAQSLIRRGDAWLMLYIPPGTEAATQRRQPAAIFIDYNASYLTLGSNARLGAIESVAASLTQLIVDRARERGLPAAHLAGPRVQTQILFNPSMNFEFYLESLIDPAILHLLLSSACIAVAGRLLREGRMHGRRWSRRELAARAVGRLTPYVLGFSVWGCAWVAWLAGWRGWPVQGSLPLLLFGQFLLFTTTAAVAALIIAVVRDVDTGFSISTVYGGSALAYSNGSLPVDHGAWFARVWSQALPYTHYFRLQVDQWTIGAPSSVSLPSLCVLLLYTALPLGAAVLLLHRHFRHATATAA